MASWSGLVFVGLCALGFAGCSGKSSSDDDDSGGSSGESGAGNASAGGSSGRGGTTGGGGKGGSLGKGGSSGSAGVKPPACGTLTSADASRIASANLGGVLRETVTRTAFLENSDLLGRSVNGGQAPESLEFADDASKSIDELIEELETKILADGNVETTTESSVTFRMTPAVYCAPEPEDVRDDPQWAAEMQQDCADDLAEHPLRVVVERIGCDGGDAVSLTPEIGTARFKPVVLLAEPRDFALLLDIADVVHYAQEGGDGTDFDSDAGGKVSFTLSTASPNVVSFGVTLDTPLVFGSTDNDEHLRATVAAGRVFSAEANSLERTVSAGVQLGAVSLTAPFATFIDAAFDRNVASTVPPTDSVVLDVPGITGALSFNRATEHLELTGLGLGGKTTTVKNGGTTLLTVDVNAALDRSLDVGVDVDPVGNVAVKPSPGFALELGYSLASVSSKIQSIQQFALDDLVTIALTGSSPGATLLPGFDGDLALTQRATGPALRVDAGKFTLESRSAAEQNVAVGAGQCLRYDPSREGTHALLHGYYAGACE